MDEDDELGDPCSDVLQPFQSPDVLPPPPHRSIDLDLRSQDEDAAEANSASNDASKLSQDMSFNVIG